jgi:hypothetical protein
VKTSNLTLDFLCSLIFDVPFVGLPQNVTFSIERGEINFMQAIFTLRVALGNTIGFVQFLKEAYIYKKILI